LSTRNGAEPREETLFARKPRAKIHEVEQTKKYPSKKKRSFAKH